MQRVFLYLRLSLNILRNYFEDLSQQGQLIAVAISSALVTLFLTLALVSPKDNSLIKHNPAGTKSESPIKKAPKEQEKEKFATKKPTTPTVRRELSLLKKNQTLIDHFLARKLDVKEAYAIVNAIKGKVNVRLLKPKTEISLYWQKLATQKESLSQVTIRHEFDSELSINKNGNSFKASLVELPFSINTKLVTGLIKDSLYMDAQKEGVPNSIISRFTNLNSYDVDFQRDIREGSEFSVYYQTYKSEKYNNVKEGDILYGRLKLRKNEFEIFKYSQKPGQSIYLNQNGESIQKALLKTPIDGARISSRFGKRKHPILGYYKTHKGIDFGARSGTPIRASGDGTIDRANWYGSYGRYVSIRHKNGYSTAYAHMSKIAKGMKKGKRIKQGQIIGYVGSSGRSTGAHLHYEVLKNKRHINPSTVKVPPQLKLAGKELAAFKKLQTAYISAMRGEQTDD